jgi:RimJ/RimL family protein N-acetyltransferase
MGLHHISWIHRTATTGALIGEAQYRGNGYGTEAKMLLLDYAFRTLNLRKVCSNVIAFNERSQRYNEKCGYQVEGTQRKHIFRGGVYHDLILMAVFCEDWLPLWEAWKSQE